MLLHGALWWLVTSAIGWLSWPIISRLFPRSALSGYSYSRAFGLLLFAYPLWLLATLGVISHTAVTARILAVFLAVGSFVAGWFQRHQLVRSLRDNWLAFFTVEALYLALFAILTIIKCYSPAIEHTEQPMDMMMLSTLLRSADMPPADAWLAGYPVSYYYGGYFLVAQVAHLTGTPASEAYNLGLVSVYSTAGVTGLGVFHELVQRVKIAGKRKLLSDLLAALAGVIALLFTSNVAGIILAGERVFSIPPGTWLARLGGPPIGASGEWWWWQAGRAFLDTNWLGRLSDVITEFPAFSFLLGDLHPHLMALPFGMLALGAAVEIENQAQTTPWWRIGLCWAVPVIIGALGWTNTWDLPVYAVLIISVYLFARLQDGIKVSKAIPEILGCVGWMLMAVVLFLPFYGSLSTQVQGIGTTYYTKTRLTSFILTQGVWLVPIGVYLHKTSELRSRTRRIYLFIVVTCLPWLLTLLIGSPGRTIIGAAASIGQGPWVALILSAVITLSLDALADKGQDTDRFVALLGLVGAGLLYITEFFYVRDFFNSRMNTYFKLSYQAWALLCIAACVATWRLINMTRRVVWLRACTCCALAIACLYTCLTVVSITQSKPYTPSLDGSAYLRIYDPAEFGAIRWLNEHAPRDAVLVEAESPDYSMGNRLSTFTGVPTLLGWPGHERQWRGEAKIVMKRKTDVQDIYTSTDQREVLDLLSVYGVKYVYIGETERTLYQLSEEHIAWFGAFLHPVYAQAGATLYQVP